MTDEKNRPDFDYPDELELLREVITIEKTKELIILEYQELEEQLDETLKKIEARRKRRNALN